jgi:hypothetical protein
MRDPVSIFVDDLKARGVTFEVMNSQLRWRAPHGIITEGDKQMLSENAAIIISIVNPDLTLPDVLIIPSSTPNTVEALGRCIDGQRLRRAA